MSHDLVNVESHVSFIFARPGGLDLRWKECYGEFTVFESFLCLTVFSILKTLTKASST